MKKRKTVFAVLLTAVLLAGCAGRSETTSTFDPGQSSIYVTQEGQLSTATVETYEDQDYYNEAEWKTSLEAAVAAYNGVNGEGAAALKSCSLKKGTARMIFEYATGDDLVRFAKEYEDTANAVDKISVLPIEEAVSQAASDNISLVKPSDGKAVTAEDVMKQSGSHAVVVEGETSVLLHTEGKILFTSEGISLRDSFTAKTTEGKNYIIFK